MINQDALRQHIISLRNISTTIPIDCICNLLEKNEKCLEYANNIYNVINNMVYDQHEEKHILHYNDFKKIMSIIDHKKSYEFSLNCHTIQNKFTKVFIYKKNNDRCSIVVSMNNGETDIIYLEYDRLCTGLELNRSLY